MTYPLAHVSTDQKIATTQPRKEPLLFESVLHTTRHRMDESSCYFAVICYLQTSGFKYDAFKEAAERDK